MVLSELTDKAFYKTMTSTGYIAHVFTEINPTSTTTVIKGTLQGTCCVLGGLTFGPFVVATAVTTYVQPTPGTVTVTRSQSTVISGNTGSLSSITRPPCEYLVLVVLLSVVRWF